jgi:hypothetical protein
LDAVGTGRLYEYGRRAARRQAVPDGRPVLGGRYLPVHRLERGQHVGVDLAGYPDLVAYRGRIAARPAVQEAMKAEGLVK